MIIPKICRPLFAIIFLAATFAGAFESFGHVCAVPANLPSLVATEVDFKNTQASSDFHLFVLSWSPVFCAQHSNSRASRSECLNSAPSFIAAGLIPQSRFGKAEADHPRNCIPSMPLSQALMRRNYCLTPNPQYMQDQWVRFGGCSFANANEFFDRIAQLWTSIQKPDLLTLAGRSETLTAEEISKSFVASNSSLGLRPNNLIVSFGPGSQFSGVTICYDRQFSLLACPRAGAANRMRLTVRAPRK